MIFVLDNYDSFTYNIVQYLGEMDAGEIVIRRNDQITTGEIAALAPDKIVLSPGPCTPTEAGITLKVIERFAGEIPIFGVCLGHQAIGQAFGGRVVRAGRLMHGKVSPILHRRQGVFAGLPMPLTATRYHSLLVERDSLPQELEITAETAEGEIMGLRHKTLAVEGVQFHPESVLTPDGKALLRNFVFADTDVETFR
ncbi:MAG: aminodeoxychorismate/anthranilate synthase component II [Armatimonadetes bacterium]|nr:aminodeoxychorismate/anthranilate synthase component II [Armatimonadota bacterium]